MVGDIWWHWGSAYDISVDHAQWKASRKGEPQHILYANSEDGLRDLIRWDYQNWKGLGQG